MKITYKKVFLKAFDKLDKKNQELVVMADKAIRSYYDSQKAPFGLRIKKLVDQVFEARVSDKLRIVWLFDGESLVFTLLGNHEDVRRFIKTVKN